MKKIPGPGRVDQDPTNRRKFKVKKGNGPHEVDVDIEITSEGEYQVEQLSTIDADLADKFGQDSIRWLCNFSVKHAGGGYDNLTYRVTIPGLANRGSSKVIIDQGNGAAEYRGTINGNTIELNNGDPAAGLAP